MWCMLYRIVYDIRPLQTLDIEYSAVDPAFAQVAVAVLPADGEAGRISVAVLQALELQRLVRDVDAILADWHSTAGDSPGLVQPVGDRHAVTDGTPSGT